MKKIALVALTAAMGAAVGCQGMGKKQELSQVPPPPAESAQQAFEPVVVEPAQAVPAYTEPVAMEPAPTAATYTIQKNDTLWSIATAHYGNGHKWQDIVAANPGLNPTKLPVGKTITLP